MTVLPAVWLALAIAVTPGVAAPGPVSAGKDLTVELIFGGALDRPAPSSLQWSPDGRRLAFLRKGELLLHDTSTGTTAPLTPGGEETPGALHVSSYRWAPRGDALIVVAGSDLHLVRLRGGGAPAAEPPVRLTRTEAAEKDPKISPDGTMAGFVRDHDLWVIDLPGGAERRLTGGAPEGVQNGEVDWVYEEEFGLSTGWWWSPDAARVAYLQFDQREVPRYPLVDWIPTHPTVTWQRYPKAGDANAAVRAGLVAARGTGGEPPPTTWLDTGQGDRYLPRAGWTPAGAVAVQRLDRDQTHLELLVCDPATAGCRAIHEESDRHWVNIDDDLMWLPDGRFVIGSERDGWRHLYLHQADGRVTRRLTQGEWVVTDLHRVDAKEGWVWFTATEKDPAERHLYRVRLDGSGMVRLTSEPGWHVALPSPAGSLYADTFSSVTSPPSVAVRGADGSRRALIDAGAEELLAGYRRGRVEYRHVTAADGTRLPAAITLPPDFDPSRRYPVLIHVYGGPHGQTVANTWDTRRGLWHQMMAARGVIVWTLDNRGAGNRGHAWETPIFRDMGRQELADQLEGIAYLRALPYVDPSRLAIWGWSYGGYMTLNALTAAPTTFVAGVSVAPVADWKDYDTIYTERYMDRPADNPEGYASSSPLRKAGRLARPLLLVHGTADDNVHMQNSVQLLEAFMREGRPVELMLYPGKDHGLAGADARTHLFTTITRFLERHLLGAEGR